MKFLPCNQSSGEQAFQSWLRLAFQEGERIWLKLGHNRFLTGEVSFSGRFPVWATKGSDKNRRKSVCYDDGYGYLSQLAQSLDGGAFYIPGKPSEYPLKEFCSASDDIGGEMDDGTAEEQWQRIDLVAQLSGLTPAYIIGSGGKSAHPHWKLDTSVPIDKRTFYARMVAIALLGDPAVTNPHQPMRVPGFFRREKGKQQTLEFYSNARYTPEEFEAGTQQCFAALDFTWRSASEFSEKRWQATRRVLASKLARSEKEAKVREILALPESELPGNKRRREVEQKRTERCTVTGFIGRTTNSLVDAVNQASEKLGADTFDWAGHSWQWGGNKARGYCPWHESTTGTAGWIAPLQNGNGWGFACPTCTDNKQLNAFAYWWHLKHGINASYPKGKEWVAAAKEFCQSAGVVVPEFIPQQQWNEPDVEFFAARSKQMEEWEEQLDHYLSTKRLESFLGKTLKQIKKFVSQAPKHLGVEGFGEAPVPQANTEGIVQFKAGDREKIISQIALQAKKDGRRAIILDSSEPGTGKSHNWGEMSNGVLGVDKLFYTSPGHRNPTVSTVESNCVDLHVRNNGLYEDESKQTALGNNHIRWAKTNKGEKPNLTGNCSRTPLFHTLSSKGYHAETSAAASINSICKTCEFAPGCAGVKDENGNLIMQPAPGNTYRSDRQEALAHPKIRCSLDSLPTIEALKEGDEQEGKEPQRVAIIVDEFHQEFRATNLTQAELTELDSTWAYFETRHLALQQEIQQIKSLVQQKRDDLETLEDKEQIRKAAENIISLMRDLDTTQKLIQRLPGVLDAVRPIVHTLRLVIAGDLPTTQQTYHGWNENLLREEIGKLPEGLTEAIEVLSALNPKLSSLLDGTEADSVSQRGVEGSTKQKKESSATLKYIRKAFEKEAKQEAKDRLKSVPANWVVPVLKILNGDRGSFRVKNGTLEVVTPNHRHQEQLLAADLAVVLDATLSREELAENLGIDPSEIILIQQERQSYENLTVLQVVGMGKLTKNRSSELNSRLDALLEELDKKHPSNAVIDHLAVKRQGDGHWFADSRATNAYQDKTALITVGSPYMDIGSLAMVYSTMTGDKNAVKGNPRFDKFVQRFKESEMIQAGGRLRVHRRKEEQLFWYVVSDEDIGYLKSAFPGATFEAVSALSITPEAASESERTFSAIMQAAAQLAKEKVEQEKFEKLNQTEIALRTGIAQGTVSKQFSKSKNELIAKVGGWTGFKKIFQALVSSYRDWNIFSKSLVEQLGEDAAHIAQTYLPQFLKENQHDIKAIASECVNIADIIGWKPIQAFLHLMPHESRVNMLTSLMEQLSEDWRMQFLEVLEM